MDSDYSADANTAHPHHEDPPFAATAAAVDVDDDALAPPQMASVIADNLFYPTAATTLDDDDEGDNAADVVDLADNEDYGHGEDDTNIAAAPSAAAPQPSSSINPFDAISGPSSVHPVAISQVDKVIKQSLHEAAAVAAAISKASGNSKKKSGAGGAAAVEALAMGKDAKIAVHKAANIFVLMMAALVEHNRREILVAATADAQKGGRKAGASASAGLAAAQRKYKGIIGVKDIEAALEAAGYKHLIPMLSTKRGRN